MKTRTWILLICLLLILCAALSVFLLRPGESARFAQIVSDGVTVRTVDLGMEQSFTVDAPNGGSNTVTVQEGKIAVTAASCPDHYCMARGYCDGGAQIVCLPNRLIIRFLGDAEVDLDLG